MASLTATVWTQFSNWTLAELFAVIFAILYLLLAIRENIWCWFCAGVSTAIYVSVYFGARLYMESLLNVFYFAMAIYGWFAWRQRQQLEQKVVSWPLKIHVTAALVILACVVVTGSGLDRYTDAAFPYIDSATTFAAVWATFLVARKVLENWWYWLVIDLVSIAIYWSRGLELTAILFVVYVAMIPFGLMNWSRSFRRSKPIAAA